VKTGISRIASSFLPFGPGDQGDEEEGEAVGVTEEVVVFVSNISKHPKTWLDFPLFVDDRHTDGKSQWHQIEMLELFILLL